MRHFLNIFCHLNDLVTLIAQFYQTLPHVSPGFLALQAREISAASLQLLTECDQRPRIMIN